MAMTPSVVWRASDPEGTARLPSRHVEAHLPSGRQPDCLQRESSQGVGRYLHIACTEATSVGFYSAGATNSSPDSKLTARQGNPP
eukprot:666862-Amphidinium_carterae.1